MHNASRILRPTALAVGIVALFTFPLWAANPYILSTGVVVLLYATMTTSWNFVGGLTGYMSIGHAAWFGLGAYATGLLIVRLEVPSFLALALSAVIVAVIAVPIGFIALKARGISFVIVTLALLLVLQLVFQGWASLTGGSRGLAVPRPFPDMLRPDHHAVFFTLFAALLIVNLLLWWVIDRSRFGLRLKTIREDEDKAQSLGVPTVGYKLAMFVLSSTLGGLAGGLYALWFGDLDPIFVFSVLFSVYAVLMALLGGVRHLFGPVLGAVIVGIGIEYFKSAFGDTQLHLVATGVLLAVVVLFMPEGLIPAVQSLFQRFKPQQTSIRESTVAELREQEEGRRADESSKEDAVGLARKERT